MKKALILAASLTLFSAPVLAQAPMGGDDRSLGNGNVESQAVGTPRSMGSGTVVISPQGGMDPTMRNGSPSTTGSTGMMRPQGGEDRSLGNGNVESQRLGR
jgi:hypothetical protein